jgi:hypothetical protein
MGRSKLVVPARQPGVVVPGLPAFVSSLKDKLGFETVADILPERPIRTMFTSYNRATEIGGHPMRRLALMHGANQSGKSALAIGIAESFRLAGHIPVLFDTEFSAEAKWYNKLARGNGFLFYQPGDMDEMVRMTQGLFDLLKAARAQKKAAIGDSVGYCIVVDTITKLIPLEMLRKIIKQGIGKQFPGQANAISLWLKILIPQLYRLGSTMILVTQERENLDAGTFGPKHKIAGGQAIQFDNSLRIQMAGIEKIREKDGDDEDRERSEDDEKERGRLVGFGHGFIVQKNKAAGVSEARGMFFTANGHGGCPLGFDLAREVVEEADVRGCVRTKEKVTVLRVGDAKVVASGGRKGIVAKLQDDPELRQLVADELDKGLAA